QVRLEARVALTQGAINLLHRRPGQVNNLAVGACLFPQPGEEPRRDHMRSFTTFGQGQRCGQKASTGPLAPIHHPTVARLRTLALSYPLPRLRRVLPRPGGGETALALSYPLPRLRRVLPRPGGPTRRGRDRLRSRPPPARSSCISSPTG